MTKRNRALALLVPLALVAAACGGDDADSGDTGDTDAVTDDDTGDDAGDDDADTGDDGADTGDDDADTGDTGDTGDTDGGDAPAGDAITIALGSEPTSLDPHLVDDGGERAVNDNVYETLLTRTPDGDLAAGLAVDLPEQVDDTTWRFELRDDVTFHDGTPFDAESVVASVDRMIRLIGEGVTDNDGFFGTLSGAEAVDDHTVDILTTGPDGVLPARMYWLKMVPPSAADSDDLSDSVVGTGPYQFVEWVRGERVVLEANPDHWGGVPPITEVNYAFVSEAGSRFAGLLSGDYDLITNLSPADVDGAPQVATAQGQEHPLIILDADDGITADLDVRRALNLAVDKEAIAESLYGGYATIDQGQVLSPSILGHNPDLEPYPYDPDQAAQLLEDAGAAGGTITIVGESSGRWLLSAEVVQAVAGFWEDVGLQVDVQLPEFGQYLDVLFDRENRADSIFVSSSNDILDADRQLSTYYQAGGVGSSNTDEELAQLVEDGRTTTDPDEREAIYQEAVSLAYDQAYFVWLINNEDIYGLSERMDWTPRVDSKLLVAEMSVSG